MRTGSRRGDGFSRDQDPDRCDGRFGPERNGVQPGRLDPADGPRGRRVEAPELPKTPAAPAPDTDTGIQTAPLAGVLHLTPSPGEPPFAPVGAQIAVGATVAIIEAMKVFIEVKAEVAGIVQAVLASAGSDVAAGQALFRLV